MSSNVPYPPNNGAIKNIAKVIDAVVASAKEAELGALFINAQEAVYLQRILIDMGHPQPKTPIQMDNSTAKGFINSKIQPKRTKLMDMRFEWLKDTFRLGGQIEFGIIYIHTQLNTTVYVGITTKKPKKTGKK